MSFFSWFGKKEPASDPVPSQGFGSGQSDATLPMHDPSPTREPGGRGAESDGRKGERRELLYQVIRECMTGAGVLSSTYKFKVLSLDSTGHKYLIMMDIPHVHMLDPTRLAEIEGTIARSGKERFGFLVTAVYWRINELVTAGQRPRTPARAAATNPAEPQAAPESDTALEREMQAFKSATSRLGAGNAPRRSGEKVRSGRRSPETEPDFSDTERFDPASGLGPSQFGGLG
jgi:hypothetical protein